VPLLDIHHAALVEELKDEHYARMNGDEAWEALTSREFYRKTEVRAAGVQPHQRLVRESRLATELPKRLLAVQNDKKIRKKFQFTDDFGKKHDPGVPGFPNAIDREDFDRAWSEAVGDV